ncbi:MAG: 1-acyl-sn-glycerol-3-phosphate acyltransferase [Chitinophagales bacterium]|jgi:1-acyl-sn-glycerol-3-phosphate acyltransferase
MPESVRLLKSRRFLPFFITQLLGAFNDNLYKNGLTIFIAFQAANISKDASNSLVNIATALFILPFFLFSPIAGQLADKFEKSLLIRRIKLLEIGIMLLAAVAFYLQSPALLIAILFLMGTQSALFGPVKYSLLPQALKPEELVGGNAMVEFGTFLSILLGLIASVFIIGFGTQILSVAVVIFAIIGYWASRSIPSLAAAAPELKISFNIISQTRNIVRDAHQDRSVFYSIIGISWFWFIGITYVTQLPNYVRYELGGDEHVYIMLLAMFSIGIGAGSFLCERMSGRIVELGLVPIGALGLTVFGVDIYFAQPIAASAPLIGNALLTNSMTFITNGNNLRVMFDIIMLGISGGIYIVPLYALVQQRSDAKKRSRIIAANNIVNALFMVVASLYGLFGLSSGLSISMLFLIMALMNAVVALFIYRLVPEFIMRLMVWLLIHSIYRINKIDLDKIPGAGPAVLVCNHVSFVDALILAGSIKRPIRFVMYYKIFQIPLLSFVFKTLNAIPIAGAKEDSVLMEQAFDKISQSLKDGELVCIFPEGKITDTGKLNLFKPCIKKVLERNPVPVVPLALRGLWGSFFSLKHGNAMSRLFSHGLYSRIELIAVDPIPARDASLTNLYDTVSKQLSV